VSEPRIIKKYPNRRLYDTEQSRYITLADLRKLVMQGVNFQVVDANSKQDLTRTVLLQIIAELEAGGQPLFTTDILTQIVRFYGATAQDVFTVYLKQSLDLFEQQRKLAQDQMRGAMSGNPVSAMTELTQRNLSMWRDIQSRFFHSAGMAGGGRPEQPRDSDGPPGDDASDDPDGKGSSR